MAKKTAEVLEEVEEKPVKKKPIAIPTEGLSTGSTLLNLACSGRPDWGFAKGYYIFFVGDSNSGKSWASLNCFAEAGINPNFSDYRMIYDNAERGALMDIKKYFGEKVADKLEVICSDTIESFYDNIDDALREKKPFIYVLDSMDSLTSEPEKKKFKENKAIRRKLKAKLAEVGEEGKEKIKGSFGDGKAKRNSSDLRQLIAPLNKSGSILIIISQTRDNVGTFSFDKKTRSGGHALRFYATIEMWSSVKEKIKTAAPVKGKYRHIGTLCKIQVKRTRISGKEHTIELPIYTSSGIDDTRSCIDYLLEENHWKKSGGTKENPEINAKELGFKGSREDLIQHIEDNNKEQELRNLVTEIWHEIEQQSEVARKKRY